MANIQHNCQPKKSQAKYRGGKGIVAEEGVVALLINA